MAAQRFAVREELRRVILDLVMNARAPPLLSLALLWLSVQVERAGALQLVPVRAPGPLQPIHQMHFATGSLVIDQQALVRGSQLQLLFSR